MAKKTKQELINDAIGWSWAPKKKESLNSELIFAVKSNQLSAVLAAMKKGARPQDSEPGEWSKPLGHEGRRGRRDGDYSAMLICALYSPSLDVFDALEAQARRAEGDWIRLSVRLKMKEGLPLVDESIEQTIALAARFESVFQRSKTHDMSNVPLAFGTSEQRMALIERCVDKLKSPPPSVWASLASLLDEGRLFKSALSRWENCGADALDGALTANAMALAHHYLLQRGAGSDLSEAIQRASKNDNKALARSLASPIHAWAILAGQREWVEARVSEPDRSWINAPATLSETLTPLSAALMARDLSLAQKLINVGANASCEVMVEGFKGPVPLMLAQALAGDSAGVALLLDAGAPIALFSQTLQNEQGSKRSALRWVSERGHQRTELLALERGADPKALSRGSLAIAARAAAGKTLSWFSRSAREAAAPLKQESGELKKSASQLSSTGELNMALMSARAAQCSPPRAIEQKIKEAMEMAQTLSESGQTPASSMDAADLKRLWEINLPLFLDAIAKLPASERSWSRGSEAGVWEKLDGALDSAMGSMSLMRSRALSALHDRVDVEAAVIASNTERALGRFKGLIDGSDERSEELPSVSNPARPGV